MVQENCQNYLVCNQFINKNVNNLYCKDCLFYFNYTFTFKNNNINNCSSSKKKSDDYDVLICPICLDSPTLFIKQKSCDHYICSDCIYSVYFDRSYIINMPVNPVYAFKKSWDLYIYSNQSYKFRTKILNEFENYIFDEELYNHLIENYKYFIPSLFKKNLKELVHYQLEKNNYITGYKDIQYKKINTIKKCPYCRKYENDDEFINNEIDRYRHTHII